MISKKKIFVLMHNLLFFISVSSLFYVRILNSVYINTIFSKKEKKKETVTKEVEETYTSLPGF